MQDADALLKVLGDPQVMRFSLKGPYGRKDCGALIDKCLKMYERNNYGLYAVLIRETGQLVGYCGFFNQLIDGLEEVELGYRLASSFWGQGLGTEVAQAMLDYGFGELGFQRIISIIEAENHASIRVAEKLGLKHEKDTLFQESIAVRIYAISKASKQWPTMTDTGGA